MNTAHYETDFYLWTQQQADLLRQRQFNRVDLDIENIAEEIESMGKRDRRSISSYLQNVLLHLLKWQYQPDRRGTSWELSIDNGRYQILDLLEESPSLKPQLEKLVTKEYPQARKNAAGETGLPLTTFPDQCPFTVEQITGDYWPE
jgi:hypothetical protein